MNRTSTPPKATPPADTATRPAFDCLIIGGPPEYRAHIKDADLIPDDLAGILLGPPRPIHDYDVVVYWPTATAFKPPASWDSWHELISTNPSLPQIPDEYWDCSPLSATVTKQIESALVTRCIRFLGKILDNSEAGQMCVCVVPPKPLPGVAQFAFHWLTLHLSWRSVPTETPRFDPVENIDRWIVTPLTFQLGIIQTTTKIWLEDVMNNSTIKMLEHLTAVLPGLPCTQMAHDTPLPGFRQYFGLFSWGQLLLAEPQEDGDMVVVIPGHTNRLGDAKSLLFLPRTSHGGIAVVPEPKSLRELLQAIRGFQTCPSDATGEAKLADKVQTKQQSKPDAAVKEVQEVKAVHDSSTALHSEVKSAPTRNVPLDFIHNDGFRSIRFRAISYTFTANQAAVIQILWNAWEDYTPDVSDAALLESIDSMAKSPRLRDVFKKRSNMHPAWGRVIVQGSRKGTHRLNLPD